MRKIEYKHVDDIDLLKVERYCIWLQNCHFLRLVQRIEVLLLVIQKEWPQGVRLLLQPM